MIALAKSLGFMIVAVLVLIDLGPVLGVSTMFFLLPVALSLFGKYDKSMTFFYYVTHTSFKRNDVIYYFIKLIIETYAENKLGTTFTNFPKTYITR